MPKENLNYDRVVTITEGESLPGESPQFGQVPKVRTYHEQVPLVTLHWTADQHAQLGIKLDRAAIERQMGEQTGPVLEFFSETLERREMNDAVKALRRARDQVHGADA